MKNDTVLVGVGVIYRRAKKNAVEWFIVKTAEDGEWELPRTVVRRGESSVRSIIRLTQEQAMMRTKVLEEVGRSSAVGRVNGKAVSQKFIYYLMHCKDAGEIMGFAEFKWAEYRTAARLLSAKKDLSMLAGGRDIMKTIDVDREKRPEEDLDPEIPEEVTSK